MTTRTSTAQAQARRQLKSDATLEEFDELVDEILQDWNRDSSLFSDSLEDTYCIEAGRDNCDDWGTCEGRYHGRI